MDRQQKWIEAIKNLPTWVGGAIGLATAIISFVVLLQKNYYLGTVILGLLLLVAMLCLCIYLAFAKTPPLVAGGKGVYRFEKYRLWALVGIGLVITITVIMLAYRPSRSFIVVAFRGTATATTMSTPAPTPTSTFTRTPTPKTPSITDVSTAASPGCTPSPHSELPPQAIAIIEPLDGAKAQAPLSTLRYEHQSGLNLASGITIDFKQMKSFELSNPGFTTDFAADVVITFLDCKTYSDRIQSESGSFLTGETESGRLELHILKVERVDFEW